MARASAAPDFQQYVQPFITKNCVLCHNAQAKVGGLDLTAYHSEADAMKNRDVWEKVVSARQESRDAAQRTSRARRPPKSRR